MSTGATDTDYLTTAEAGEVLGLTQTTVLGLVRKGRFPGAVKRPIESDYPDDARVLWYIPRADVEAERDRRQRESDHTAAVAGRDPDERMPSVQATSDLLYGVSDAHHMLCTRLLMEEGEAFYSETGDLPTAGQVAEYRSMVRPKGIGKAA